MKSLHTLDYIIIAIYLAIIAAIGLYIARKQKTAAQYFIADRQVPFWAVGFTLMATLIGSGTIVGHPATVFQTNMRLLLGNMTLPIVLIFVAIYIVPFYRRVVGMSAYEYLETRFGYGARVYSSFGFIGDRILDLGGTLVGVAIAVNVMMGLAGEQYYSTMVMVIVVIGLFTTVYTSIGGIQAVVWTDVVQGVILLGGLMLIIGFLLFAPEAGAPGAVVGEAWRGGKFNLGSFEISWKSLFQENPTQWMFIAAYLFNWGRRYITDQHLVQKYLLAKTDREASKGALWGAISCVPIWAVAMFIGACLYGYYQLTGAATPEIGDNIVPHFIVNQLPVGIIGLMLAAILAAAMSSVSSDLNSISTVLTTDYFARWNPASSDAGRVWFGRLMVLLGGALMTACAIFLIPEKGLGSLMERLVTISTIISGGTLGLFMLGFMTRNATRTGSYVGIAACVLFTTYGLLTSGETPWLNLGVLNFTMHRMFIGLFGHFVLFGVGYAASVALGGYKPEDIESYTIFGVKRLKKAEG